jgi:hypothetical protein
MSIDNISVNECVPSGCTDPTALNFDSTATVNDGSCIAAVYGCMDSTAINYNAAANTADASCITCTTYEATTYTYVNSAGGNNNAYDGNPDFTYGAVTGSGNNVTLIFGAGAVESCCDDIYITDGTGTILNTNTKDVSGQTFTSSGVLNIEFDSDGSVTNTLNWTVYCAAVLGCTDATALNYDTLANGDDGSCTYLCDPYLSTSSVTDASCYGGADGSASVSFLILLMVLI